MLVVIFFYILFRRHWDCVATYAIAFDFLMWALFQIDEAENLNYIGSFSWLKHSHTTFPRKVDSENR